MKHLTESDKHYLLVSTIFIFFGGIGMHYFYLKNNKKAVLRLILSIGSIGMTLTQGTNMLFTLATLAHGILILIDLIQLIRFKLENENGESVYCETKWIRWVPVGLLLTQLV